MKLRKKGAEADIYQIKWQNSNAILKIRKTKNYRNGTTKNLHPCRLHTS